MSSKNKRSQSIRALFQDSPAKILAGDPGEVSINGISIDNRKVLPGNLFVAIRGRSADGHDFIHDAIQRGAVAVVGDEELFFPSTPYLRVENSRQALTWLAAAFYNNPGRKLTVIGVTGTDGKTTTCNLLFQIMSAAKIKAGMISTVNAIIGNDVVDTGFHVTTPDAHDVQRYLAQIVAAGLTHVVLEATSHGLAQFRVDACEFDIGVITNISHEHLDEHGTYENYLDAKSRLFLLLGKTKNKKHGNIRLSVLNQDDGSYEPLSQIATGPKVCYGFNQTADIHASSVEYAMDGIKFFASGSDFSVPVISPLVGEYNISNCLAALATAVRGLDISPEIAAKGIAEMKGIPGRMERIELGQPFTAIVDFAHTPNALRVAINAARRITNHRVIVIFGSAGLRDREKRSLMSQISIELADISIFTAEDPRTEKIDDILENMAAGAKSVGGEEEKTFWRVPDRGNAIRLGVKLAHNGDIVMACGKGHEQSMCFGTTEYPWDDRTAMRAAISELMGIHGEKMPKLPRVF